MASAEQDQNPDDWRTEDPTVLIVDDEETVLETYKMYLERERYEVRTAANGGEALVELGPEVDVVLLDRRMPGMSGDEVLEHIKDWNSDCRVAMVTAVDPDVDILEMGFDDYLTKPIERGALVDTVEQFLLFDRYEALLSEYQSVTKTYAVLKSTFTTDAATENSELEELKERRDRIRNEIQDTIDSFTDEEIAEVFSEIHPET